MGLKMMFTNSKTPMAPIIRMFTWSKVSHVVILINDTTILHSDFHGVRIEPLADLQKRSKNWMIAEFECERPQDVIDACLTQLGKPYDFTGIFGVVIRNVDIQDDSKWFCSELPVYGFEVSNQPKFQLEFQHRITPQDWLLLPHKILATS